MSIDNIVKITIQTQTLSMVQKGFGTPLILGKFDHPDDWIIRSFSNIGELLEWKTRLTKAPKESATDKEKEEAKKKEHEAIAEKLKELKETPVYKAALAIFSQDPCVGKLKIGRLKEKSIDLDFKNICLKDNDFYGVLLPKFDNDTQFINSAKLLAQLILTKRMIIGLDVNDATKPLADELKAQNNDRAFCIYSPNDEQLAAALMGKMLCENPGSSSWAYQELSGVKPYGLTSQRSDELEKARINRYINIKGIGITLDGKTSGKRFIDITRSIDWLHVRIQERLLRVLMLNKKIPYTLKGIDLVRSEIVAQLKEAIYQGVLAQNPEPQVTTPTLEEIKQAERDERVLRKVHFSGRLAGAIHTIEINGTVTA